MFLARVYHVREDIDPAYRVYEKAVKLAPTLAPARYELAQTLVAKQEYGTAMEHLKQSVTSKTIFSLTDAMSLLGVMQVRSGKKLEEGLTHLREAIELDPLNPVLMLLEALALQQQKATYAKALERYKKAIDTMQRGNKKMSFEVYANSGLLCHETKEYDEAMKMYRQALATLDTSGLHRISTLGNLGMEGVTIRLDENDMFRDFVESNVRVEPRILATPADAESEGQKTDTTDVQEKMDKSRLTFRLVEGTDMTSLPFRAGERIRLMDGLVSEVVHISIDNMTVEVQDEYESTSDEPQRSMAVFVKRENWLSTLRGCMRALGAFCQPLSFTRLYLNRIPHT